jgi:hypothetical protein
VRQFRIAELTKKGVIGMAREGTARFPQRSSFAVPIGVDIGYATAGQVIRMLEFPSIGKVIIVTLRECNTRRVAERSVSAPAWCVETRQP